MPSVGTMRTEAAEEFWRFSLAVYAASGVARMCLELQAAHRVDVNLLLCAAWVGASGRGLLEPGDFARLTAVSAPLRENVVSPLRAARDALQPMLADDPGLRPLRETVKAVELEAERMIQHRLAWWIAGTQPVELDASRRLADAAANVVGYLRHLDVQNEDSQAQAVRVLTAAIAGLQNPPWPRC